MAFKRSAVRSRLSPPGTLERLDFLGNQAFFVTKIKYWDDAGSFHRHSSILPCQKAVSTFHADRESGLFLLPKMRFTVRHIIYLEKHAPQRCNKRAKVLISANIFTKVLYAFAFV